MLQNLPTKSAVANRTSLIKNGTHSMTIKHSLWLIDDDPALRLILEDTFNDAGLEVQAFQ